MKRFIDIGNQMYLGGNEREFSFYCTVLDIYEDFSGNNVWSSLEDFVNDYKESGGNEIDRYLSLIPEELKNIKK